jgi:lipoprotein-anchoring transpeptidase ErfK/SrfK
LIAAPRFAYLTTLALLLVVFFLLGTQITGAQPPPTVQPSQRSQPSQPSPSTQVRQSQVPRPQNAQQSQQPLKKVAAVSPSKKASSPASAFVNNHYILSATMSMNGYHAEDPTVIIVDKGSHSTIVLQLQDEKIVRVLTISNAVGNTKKPTPPGRYSIVSKKKDPKWNPPKTIKHKPVAPYSETHENPLGVAAIYLNKYDIDLHGTNDPKDIRKSISHGCVRHSNSDIMRLYNMVQTGDTVYIIRRFRGTVLNKSDFKPRSRKKATA